MTDVSTTTEIPAVQSNFRLPAFSSVDAGIWFRRAEIQFRLKKITNPTVQADHVLAALPEALFPQVADWLDAQADDAISYNDLKAFLLKKFTLSPEQRAKNILALVNQPIGDQRPSQALAELRSLARLPPDAAGLPQTIDVLLALWLTRLPEKVRASITDFTSYHSDEAIASKADSLLDALHAASKSSITAAAADDDDDDPDDYPTSSQAAASQPRRSRSVFPTGTKTSSRFSTVPQPNKTQHRSSSSKQTSQLCFYHARFGPKAKKCESPCAWSRFRNNTSPIAAVTDTARVFFLVDPLTKTKFLIDTGACRSLLPESYAPSASSCANVHLVAANGSSIQTFGYCSMDISISGKQYPWKFIVADVTMPLIGADFLGHYHLLVDVHSHRLVDANSLTCASMIVAPSDLALHVSDSSHPYAALREEFADVFRPELHQAPNSRPPHGVYHFITTTGPPVYSRFRRLAPDRFAAAKQVFQDMEKLGICQKASSPCDSPLQMISKSDGTW